MQKRFALVLGLARSGVAATRLLLSEEFDVLLLDSHASPEVAAKVAATLPKNVVILCQKELTPLLENLHSNPKQAAHGLEKFFLKKEAVDVIVLSPGIPTNAPLVSLVKLASSALLMNAHHHPEMIAEIELAYRLLYHLPLIYSDDKKALQATFSSTLTPSSREGITASGNVSQGSSPQIIAVTGSNGKTTTVELITALFLAAGKKAIACGNIGYPFSDALREHSEMEFFILEASSFQLESISSFHPQVALLLNLCPNHLDRYPSMAEYQEAKQRIFLNQKQEDVAILPQTLQQLAPHGVTLMTFSHDGFDGSNDGASTLSISAEEILYQGKPLLHCSELALQGKHNRENVMAALAVAFYYDLPWEKLLPVLQSYQAPEHRCELCYHSPENIDWINDSKATSLHAMESALNSIPAERPIILIAGGKDKGFSFAPIYPLIEQRVRHLLLLGELRHHIRSVWPDIPYTFVRNMKEAVAIAHHKSREGETILLSPGTSSYDMFSSYQERGNAFKREVQLLKEAAKASSLSPVSSS